MPVGIPALGILPAIFGAQNALSNFISGAGMGAGYGFGVRTGYEDIYPALKGIMNQIIGGDFSGALGSIVGQSMNPLDSLQQLFGQQQNAIQKIDLVKTKSNLETVAQVPTNVQGYIAPQMKQAELERITTEQEALQKSYTYQPPATTQRGAPPLTQISNPKVKELNDFIVAGRSQIEKYRQMIAQQQTLVSSSRGKGVADDYKGRQDALTAISKYNNAIASIQNAISDAQQKLTTLS